MVISVSEAYGLGILKRCDEELKIAVNYMNVDDINVEVVRVLVVLFLLDLWQVLLLYIECAELKSFRA